MKLSISLLLFGGLGTQSVQAEDSRQLKKGFSIPIPTGGRSGGGSGTSQPLCPLGDWLREHYTEDSSYSFLGAAPDDVFCSPEDGATCAAEHYTGGEKGSDYEFSCTQCDLTYPDVEVCSELSCLTYECLQNEVATSKSRNRKNLDTVTVCEDYTRSEFFTVIGTTTDGTCIPNSAQRIVTKHFTEGVSNVRKVSWVLKKRYESGGTENTHTFESCEVRVDDVQCNSCQMCSPTDLGLFAADCNNIAIGASVSCEDWNSFDVLEASSSPFLVLEENVTFPVEVIQHELDLSGNANKKIMAGYCLSILFALSMNLVLEI